MPLRRRLNASRSRTRKPTTRNLFKTGSWLQGWPRLFDLAYFKYRRFALIDENVGYFVSRLKQNANPVTTNALQPNGVATPFAVFLCYDRVSVLLEPAHKVTVILVD